MQRPPMICERRMLVLKAWAEAEGLSLVRMFFVWGTPVRVFVLLGGLLCTCSACGVNIIVALKNLPLFHLLVVACYPCLDDRQSEA